MDKDIKIYDALKIAHEDAGIVYKDLSIYKVLISLEDYDWKIDYEIKDESMRGGGPHYLISSKTGEIISKRYEQ